MSEYKKVCFMYKHKDYSIDGMRSALGLAVENMYSYGVAMDHDMDTLDDNQQESLAMLRAMEGEIFATHASICEKKNWGEDF